MSSRTAHTVTCIIGCFFLLLSVYKAFFVPASYFYTSFALGSWLTLDYIDYRLNRTSILSFFYAHRHRYAFYFFFFVAFIFCFIVDYLWGVRFVKAWEWIEYTWVEYLRMYFITNISFVLGVYELYRVIKTLLRNNVPDEHLFSFRLPKHTKSTWYVILLFVGIVFLLSPMLVLLFDMDALAPYIMLLPFISISCITDAVTYFTGGRPILEDLIRINRLQLASLFLTVVIAFSFTESLNYFGHEWKYIRMPLYNIQILSVPVSVLFGWIPLVVGLVSMVNMVKHVEYK